MSSSNKPTRRDFLKATSSAALAAAAAALNVPAQSPRSSQTKARALLAGGALRRPDRSAPSAATRTTQVAMPIGGIGAGSICMNGYGGLQDFSIRTRPENHRAAVRPSAPTRLKPHSPSCTSRASSGVTKLVEGPFPPFKIFDQGLQGQGLRRGGFEGFPRFQKCIFKGEYPIWRGHSQRCRHSARSESHRMESLHSSR